MMLRFSSRARSLGARRAFSATAGSRATTWPSVAIVGVGQLGAAVASNLVRHGVDLTLFDIAGDENVPDELSGKLAGAVWVDTAREAAMRAEVVITALPGTSPRDGSLFR